MRPTAEVTRGALSGAAIILPGYRGTEQQRSVVVLAQRLRELGMTALPVVVMTGSRPSPGYHAEIGALRKVRDAVRAADPGPIALIGRSFGGRICAFLAAEEPPDALVVVGHPIAPPGRPREKDEEALALMRCPTLVVQGSEDELGPLAVLQRIAAGNPLIDIIVIPGAVHELTAGQEREAAEHVARWLEARLG